MQKQLTIYFAGPLFTQAERIWNSKLAKQLASIMPHVKIILPQTQAINYMRPEGVDFQGLVHECIRGLDSADLIIAVLDGSDADSGTCWECGYAYAKGKRVIGVKTDLRGSEDEGLNAMLRRTCEKVIYYPAIKEDIYSLAKEITSVILNVAKE
jgi:nucleoside 2-deoxyribosyltransferase